MASRELTRLKRLKIDRMTEARLRVEMNRTIENLAAESKQMDAVQQELRQAKIALQRTQGREKSLQAALKGRTDELNSIQAEADKLREALAAARKETGGTDGSGKALSKLAELEVEHTQLQAKFNATNRLLEQLQAAQEEKRNDQPAIRTADLFSKFTGEIESATKNMEGDFIVDDVEVEVRGAMGLDAGDVVMGLDHKRAINDQSATRIKFALRRRANLKKME